MPTNLTDQLREDMILVCEKLLRLDVELSVLTGNIYRKDREIIELDANLANEILNAMRTSVFGFLFDTRLGIAARNPKKSVFGIVMPGDIVQCAAQAIREMEGK